MIQVCFTWGYSSNIYVPLQFLLLLKVKYEWFHANSFLFWLHCLHVLCIFPNARYNQFLYFLDICPSHLPCCQERMSLLNSLDLSRRILTPCFFKSLDISAPIISHGTSCSLLSKKFRVTQLDKDELEAEFKLERMSRLLICFYTTYPIAMKEKEYMLPSLYILWSEWKKK